MVVFCQNSTNVSLINSNLSMIRYHLLTFSWEKFSKLVGLPILLKLVSFLTLKTTFPSKIHMTKRRKLLLVRKPTSGIQSEKLSKFLRLLCKTDQSQRVPLSGWKLSEHKFYLKDQPTPSETSGKLWREKVLKIT